MRCIISGSLHWIFPILLKVGDICISPTFLNNEYNICYWQSLQNACLDTWLTSMTFRFFPRIKNKRWFQRKYYLWILSLLSILETFSSEKTYVNYSSVKICFHDNLTTQEICIVRKCLISSFIRCHQMSLTL